MSSTEERVSLPKSPSSYSRTLIGIREAATRLFDKEDLSMREIVSFCKHLSDRLNQAKREERNHLEKLLQDAAERHDIEESERTAEQLAKLRKKNTTKDIRSLLVLRFSATLRNRTTYLKRAS